MGISRRQLFQIVAGALAAAGQAIGWLKKPKVEPLRGFIHSYGGEVWAVLFNQRGVISERPIGIDPAVRASILNDPVWGDQQDGERPAPYFMKCRTHDLTTKSGGYMGRGSK